ncbi:hypothetical protein BC937DRAFT_92227 [Endogone sp. FLAS-F59071]|nr:hypothetical protein BC937DRAFT_92227 [Endogone sp. FLAS-F59071]|eukprot:RUS21569.1 hypothetical protein BC937DRAFT_92227 [Endogone sp. FLAS-F59071]
MFTQCFPNHPFFRIIKVGAKRRTLAVLTGVLRGAWLVSPGWYVSRSIPFFNTILIEFLPYIFVTIGRLFTSLDNGAYTDEVEHEVAEWFPAAKRARLSMAQQIREAEAKMAASKRLFKVISPDEKPRMKIFKKDMYIFVGVTVAPKDQVRKMY